jgi:hypothetical protein
MQWLEMDIRQLTFPDESFDVVIDKGTMDAMLTTKGDVWVSRVSSSLTWGVPSWIWSADDWILSRIHSK